MAKKKHKTPIAPSQLPTSLACIIPSFLYLAPVSSTSAKSTAALKSLGITHILSVGKSPASQAEDVTYLRLSLLDSEEADAVPVIERACEFIDAAEKEQGKVLVHCSAAISRSPAVLIGYLMKKEGIRIQDALRAVREARGAVAPNKGFLRQLEMMEEELAENKTKD
ncbi:phosphatases II [Cladorrhinum sp. PSN332]|nr:phosphatases II [Cladorrhinum sp. PSN332]